MTCTLTLYIFLRFRFSETCIIIESKVQNKFVVVTVVVTVVVVVVVVLVQLKIVFFFSL